MHKHKRRNEGLPYKALNTRNKIHNEVRNELAGTETFLTDTQGLRLAYESPDRIYRNGSQLYIGSITFVCRKFRVLRGKRYELLQCFYGG